MNTPKKEHAETCPYAKRAYFLDCDCGYFNTPETVAIEEKLYEDLLDYALDCYTDGRGVREALRNAVNEALVNYASAREKALVEAILKNDWVLEGFEDAVVYSEDIKTIASSRGIEINGDNK